MAKKLSGQRALVTGASSGIGLELARVLAEQGANLVLVARREDRLRSLADELHRKHGVEAVVLAADLMKPGAPAEVFAATEGRGLAVDVLINNAGFGDYATFVESPWETFSGMLQVNAVALTELTHRFLPAMVARRNGRVMNVASVGAYMPVPHFAVYAATKAYVRNFTEALDYELKGTGVRAICVNPGGTKTEFMDKANQEMKAGSDKFMMSAETCARIAVRKMLAGRRNVVTGLMNAFTVWIMRFLPRAFYPWLADVGMRQAVTKKELPARPAPAALPGPSPVETPAPPPEVS